MTRTTTYCALSVAAFMGIYIYLHMIYKINVLEEYEVTMTKITDFLSHAHTVFITTKTPPMNISSCMSNSVNETSKVLESSIAPLQDYWKKEMLYTYDQNSITILSSGADLKMGTKDDISGVLALSTNRDIVVTGRYKKNIFYQSNYSSHEDLGSSGHKRDVSGHRNK